MSRKHVVTIHNSIYCIFIIHAYLGLAMRLSVQAWFTSCFMKFSIKEISTVSPPGLLKSALTTGANSRESYINVTWTPSASQLGANIFCYTASDNFGYAKLKNVDILLQQHLAFLSSHI